MLSIDCRHISGYNPIDQLSDLLLQSITRSSYDAITDDAAQRGIDVTAVVNNAGIFKVRTTHVFAT